MSHKRRILLLFLVLLLAFGLTACGGAEKATEAPAEQPKAEATEAPMEKATEAPKEEPTEAPTEAATEAAAEAGEPTEFHGAWPYKVPPEGHFNTFVPGNLSLYIYADLMEMPGGVYLWAKDEWIPLLYTSWEFVPEEDAFVVHLRKGVKWSDGSDFTADDVVTTFELARLRNWTVFKYVDEITKVDDYTVKFHMSKPTSLVERYVVRTRIRAASVYGDLAKKVMDLRAQGKGKDSEEWKALQKELNEFRPERMVVTGPYMIDPDSITEAQLVMVKNESSWLADQVKFDRLVIYNGETAAITPLVLAGEIDYATHAFPPATEKEFIAQGIRIVRPPTYSGPALYFNHNIYPLNRVEVRQAIAYAINRDENAQVSLGDSAKAVKYMVGFSDTLVPLWLSDDAMAQLNTYDYNVQKAEEILTGLGFKRDADGVWIDDKGNRMEFELTFPAEYADWAAAAQNVAEQLTKFGIKVTPRGVQFQQHRTEVREGKFQLAIRHWGSGSNPHPHFAYVGVLFSYNYVNNPVEGAKGMNFPMQQTVNGEELDLEQLIIDSAAGLDKDAQKEKITKVAVAFNQLLPVMPLWERYGNNPVNETARVTGWPADDDPLLKNSVYGDNFAVIALLQGILEPIQK